MARRRHLSGATDGRRVFLEFELGPFAFRYDLIAYNYMRRWVLFTPWGMLRLHKIMRSDSREHLHDHPMDFTSLILLGGYIEHAPGKEPRTFLPGDVNSKRAEDMHALELIDDEPVWTLLVTGPVRRRWGFKTEDGWVQAGKYDAWKKNRRANDQ